MKKKITITRSVTPGQLLKISGNCWPRNDVAACFAQALGIELVGRQQLEHAPIDFLPFCFAGFIKPSNLPEKGDTYGTTSVFRYCSDTAKAKPTIFSDDMSQGDWVMIFDKVKDIWENYRNRYTAAEVDKNIYAVSMASELQKFLNENFTIEYQ